MLHGSVSATARWSVAAAALLLACLGQTGAGQAPSALPDRRVFAHYVLCCTINGPHVDAAAMTREIALAAGAGIDGFAVNIGGWDREPVYRHDGDALFAAAVATAARFKLFLSVDPSGDLTPGEAADMVMRYQGSPAYFRVGGKPLVSSFASRSEWNRTFRRLLRARGIEIVLVPHMMHTRAEGDAPGGNETPEPGFIRQLFADDPDLDGYAWFGAGRDGALIAEVSRGIAAAAAQAGKFYIAPVTPYYLGHGPNNRVFDNAGFEGQSGQWRAAIESGATWVELLTWNDWEEQTYVRPLGPLPSVATGQWGLRTTHDGFLAADRYFIDWFRNGRAPAIFGTRAFVAFRPDPVAICQTAPRSNPCPRGWETLSDTLYVTVETAAPTTVTVRTGPDGAARTVTAGPGRSDHRFPLRPGPVKVTLTASGRTIEWSAPVEFGGAPRPDRLNMAAFTIEMPR